MHDDIDFGGSVVRATDEKGFAVLPELEDVVASSWIDTFEKLAGVRVIGVRLKAVFLREFDSGINELRETLWRGFFNGRLLFDSCDHLIEV